VALPNRSATSTSEATRLSSLIRTRTWFPTRYKQEIGITGIGDSFARMVVLCQQPGDGPVVERGRGLLGCETRSRQPGDGLIACRAELVH